MRHHLWQPFSMWTRRHTVAASCRLFSLSIFALRGYQVHFFRSQGRAWVRRFCVSTSSAERCHTRPCINCIINHTIFPSKPCAFPLDPAILKQSLSAKRQSYSHSLPERLRPCSLFNDTVMKYSSCAPKQNLPHLSSSPSPHYPRRVARGLSISSLKRLTIFCSLSVPNCQSCQI